MDQASPPPRYGGSGRSYIGQRSDSYGGHPSSCYGGRYVLPSQVPWEVPYYIFPQGYPLAQPVLGPHVTALVASSIDGSSVLLRSLPHADLHSASASDLTASFAPGPPIPGIPAFGPGHPSISGQIPPQAHVSQAAPVFPVRHIPVVAPAVPAVAPAAPAPPAVVPPTPAVLPSTPAAPSSNTARVELLKLDPIKDAKQFLDSFETIQFYLQMPEFFTGHANGSLTTDTANLDASRAWEGHLGLAVKDGTLRFLFENKGSLGV
jgi:hypothetical protein